MSRPNRWLRRYALFFDRFEIIDLDEAMDEQRNSEYGKIETITECDWLIERGYLKRTSGTAILGDIGLPGLDGIDAELDALLDEMNKHYSQHIRGVKSDDDDSVGVQALADAHMENFRMSSDLAALYAERAALHIRRSGRAIATSLEMPPQRRRAGLDANLNQAGLAKFVIEGLPVPARRLPWEDILAFRNDADSQDRLRSLRNWIAATARGGISLAEASDQIHDAVSRYRDHVRGAGIAHDLGVWESLVRSGILGTEIGVDAWMTSDTPRPFELSLLTTSSIQAEQSAPGRELSYLVKVEDAGL
jgi:hypothetical protein